MRKVAAAFLASMAAAGFSTPSPLHRIPDPLSVPTNRAGRITCKKTSQFLATLGHSGSGSDDMECCGNGCSILQ